MTTQTPTVHRMPLPRYAVAVGNEVAKGLRQAWSERVQILIELPLFTVFLLLVGLILGRGEQVTQTGRLPWEFDPYRMSWLFIGFVLFQFIYLQSVKTFWRLLGEIQTGTLEQTYLSPIPAWINIALGRVLAAILETAIVVAVLYVAVVLVVDLQLTWRAEVLVPLALAVIGGAGYSLLIAGLTLAFKRVELLQEVVLVLVMFGSGAILPLDAMPGWVGSVADFVFITHPIEAARTTLLDGESIGLWGTGGWAWLIATALGWLALGTIVFGICERHAKRAGSLAHY
ncbi:MAG: ABC transporter permease [Pseudonocardiaceae bacterium]